MAFSSIATTGLTSTSGAVKATSAVQSKVRPCVSLWKLFLIFLYLCSQTKTVAKSNLVAAKGTKSIQSFFGKKS